MKWLSQWRTKRCRRAIHYYSQGLPVGIVPDIARRELKEPDIDFEVDAIVPGPIDMGGGLRLMAVEGLNGCVIVRWHRVEPEETHGERSLWAGAALADDLGTRYRFYGADSTGLGGLHTGEHAFVPGVPRAARVLTFTWQGLRADVALAEDDGPRRGTFPS